MLLFIMNDSRQSFLRRTDMKKIIIFVLLFPLLLVVTGCSTVAPGYNGSRQNIEAINSIGDFKIAVDRFTDFENPDNKKQLSMRGNTATSPYGTTFASYIESAVRQDLSISGKFLDSSKNRISGVLLKNDVDASGFSTGTGICEVEFSLVNNSSVLFKKRIIQNHQWESSFAGAVAIPKATNEYPVMVEKLLNKLFTDNDFIAAVKSSIIGR
jgi:hypothetical protein